jgi:hypothetical protein
MRDVQAKTWCGRLLGIVLLFLLLMPAPATALDPGVDVFARTWARTDAPVAKRSVERTWLWGPGAFTALLWEPYADAPGGQRLVQYFDKSRMEISDPDGYRHHPWYVTNGLLVVELVSGRLQVGDNAFLTREPAEVNVAGDADDPQAPTYATFGPLRSAPPIPDGAPVIARLAGNGSVTQDMTMGHYGVRAAERVQVPGIDHQVASVFWEFMQSRGVVEVDAYETDAALLRDPFYATGYPISEAYWTAVRVGGVRQDVLVQCFERRCLTWTPGNKPGWQVEAGNVGRHYYMWRYGADIPSEPPLLDGSHPQRLAPTPLDHWSVDHDGLTLFRMSNQTPYALTIQLDGPEQVEVRLPACDDCEVYQRDEPPLLCRADTPEHEQLLRPGNYRVQVTYHGPHTDRPGGHWTLVPNSVIDTCWVLVGR